MRSDAPWIQQPPMSAVKVQWVGCETGTWASPHHWEKGYTAPPHKHLAGARSYVIFGKLQVRNCVLNADDYVYEPSGILHDATTALEDTTYLFICNARFVFRREPLYPLHELGGDGEIAPAARDGGPSRSGRIERALNEGGCLQGVWRSRGARLARSARPAAAWRWRGADQGPGAKAKAEAVIASTLCTTIYGRLPPQGDSVGIGGTGCVNLSGLSLERSRSWP